MRGGAGLPPLEQLRLSGTATEKSAVFGRMAISPRKVALMQVSQCGNQEAHAEVLCRWLRAARAIAIRVAYLKC
jgi:hypothetical protein